MTEPAPDLRAALTRFYGFDSFRAGQEEIVGRAVAGRDTLALMPTGAGKSLCYQLAAMLRPTPTLVVSPLIALMKDQVDNLPVPIAPHATLINSSLDPTEAARRLQALAAGEYRLIYAAPERLRQRNFVAALRSIDVGLVVIDEVHCVSMWGHDFRPDYLFLRRALEGLDDPSVLGLTATATPETAKDIALSLGRDLDVVRASVERPNLRYDVEFVENEEDRLRTTVRVARATKGSGIIYARSREKCEHVANVLRRNGVDAVHYHARLEPVERSSIQERFLSGRARVVVATTAFGMGIDKADIRWVILYNFPQSMESYVQMVGRAGRDGAESVCTLLAGGADASSLLRFARADRPTVEQLRAMYRTIREHASEGTADIEPEDLTVEGWDDPRVLVGMLERVELLRRDYDAGRAMRIEILPPPADTPQRIADLLETYERGALDRARRMIAFADTDICRHSQVARHFGESVEVPCGMCDICDPAASERGAGHQERPLPRAIAPAIIEAVDALPWPVGIKGLVATLRGTVDAPPSAHNSDAFGVLSAAPSGKIRRWVDALLESGNLEQFEKDDFKLIRVARRNGYPAIYGGEATKKVMERRTPLVRDVTTNTVRAAVDLVGDDQQLFDRLRAWRQKQAQAQGLPSYTVMKDATLREIAVRRPKSRAELAQIDGIGPAKLERYGNDIFALVSGESASGTFRKMGVFTL